MIQPKDFPNEDARFLAYAESCGFEDPDALREANHLNGRGFIPYLLKRWMVWGRATGHPRGTDTYARLTDENQAAFDVWLWSDRNLYEVS